MNNNAAYTPLESLLLFQSLLCHGIEAGAFQRISNVLKDNSLIKEGATYDAGRLSPESLQELFLHLLREELKSETDNSDRADPGLSPNSKKRKLQSPPLPSLKEANDHIEKVPILVNKLYARYRDYVVREIREDEERFDSLQGEIRDIERSALDSKKVNAPHPADENGTPVRQVPETPALSGAQDLGLPNGGSQPHPSVQKPEPRNEPPRPQQAVPEKPSESPSTVAGEVPSAPASQLAPPQPAGALLGRQAHVGSGLGGRSQEPVKPANGTTQVLQPPQGVVAYTPDVPLPVQPPPEGLQRPEGIARPKVSPALQSSQPQLPGQLKWEPPYQPNPVSVPAQHRQPLTPGPYPTQKQTQGSPLPQWNAPVPPPIPSPRPPAPQPGPHQGQPVSQTSLPPAQIAGHHPPPLQPAPMKAPSESGAIAPPTMPPSSVPVPTQGRPAQPPHLSQPHYPGYPHPSPKRPLAAASPTTPIVAPTPGPTPSQQRPQPPSLPAPLPHHTPVSSPSPAPSQAAQRGYNSPYNLPPRPAIPDHIAQPQQKEQRLATATPTPPSRVGSILQPPQLPQPPQTPNTNIFNNFHALGSGTKWKVSSTPSTPHPLTGDLAAPSFEPLSPVLAPSVPAMQLPESRPRKVTQKPAKEGDISIPKTRGRPPRVQRGQDVPVTPVSTPHPPVGQPANSPAEELPQSANDPGSAIIKNEETTPRPPTEAGDTTADESVPGRRRTSRRVKRKRRESSPPLAENREPPPPPSHVLWSRAFNKVSHSAMEQIIGHRSANMFANQIRERDAPGYRTIVLRPQDLKSIRAAISHGNKAAAAAAAALPGGDPGTSSVWLPIGEGLVPPKGIINSAQLDRELAHMFSNAIMYNPDPDRGPGPRFMREILDADADGAEGGATDALGYKVDENGVVNDTRAMFVEVQKLVNDLQSAERQRGAPPAPATGTNTRQASVTGGHSETPARRDDIGGSAAEDADEQTATEQENVANTAKRRRITRG